MSRAPKRSYPEIDEIREDLDSLKDNVIGLTKHIQKDGAAHAQEAGEIAKVKVQELRKQGQRQMKKVEHQVKRKPMQSLAIAFAGGLLASALLRNRG